MSGGPAGGGEEGHPVHLVLVTGPDRSTLRQMGRRLVEERLCACANVLDGMTSVYRWKGRVEQEPEALALLKTTAAQLEALEDRVVELHPYDEPEFLAFGVDRGSASYLAWVAGAVGDRP